MPRDHLIRRGRTALIVDDDLGVRLIIARMLEGEAYAVRIAPSAAVALLILATEPGTIDLALIDVRMPGMNGLDLALELRRRWPDLPVGLMSAHEPEEMASTHQSLAALPFLVKPFTAQALLTFLETLAAQAGPAPADAVGPA